MKKIVIYGAGGHAREILFQIEEDGSSEVVAFVDDIKNGGTLLGKPVLSYPHAREVGRSCPWILGIGDSGGRKAVWEKLRKDGIAIGGFLSKHAFLSPTATIGSEVQIFAHSVISDQVVLSDNVIVNFSCVVSHDVQIGAHSTLSPRVAIAGRVRVGKGVFIGIGASIKNGTIEHPITIGDGVQVGAGACVIDSVLPGSVIAGVPARPIKGSPN